ncbi:unnamed protein product [Caenorhabditis sp. 36 PRJEB53466]|nr:unnamed protein product [Caenorhabditis sp. 36 PRJEB53466]
MSSLENFSNAIANSLWSFIRTQSIEPEARNNSLERCKVEIKNVLAKVEDELNKLCKTSEDAEKHFQEQKAEIEKALETLSEKMKKDEEQADLEHAKKEGMLKIANAEKEKKAVHEGLRMELEAMFTLAELFQKLLKAIQMTIDKIAEKKEHRELENEQTLEQILKQIEGVLERGQISKEFSQVVQTIFEPLNQMYNSLMNSQKLGSESEKPILDSIPKETNASLIRQLSTDYEQRLKAMKDQAARQEEEEERRFQEKFQQRREARTKKNEESRREQKRIQEEQDEKRKKMDEQQKIFDEERERRRRELNEHIKKVEAENKREIEEMNRKCAVEKMRFETEQELRRERFENDVHKNNEQMDEKNRAHEEEMTRRAEENRKADMEHLERIRRMKEEFLRNREKSKKMWEEKMEKMKQQYEQIKQAFKYRIWNDIIERNWTNRLNFLRSANREVARSYSYFQSAANNLQYRLNSAQVPEITKEKQLVQPYLFALLQAIDSEQSIMNKELETLQEMFDKTGKSFVIQIRQSLTLVINACAEFKSALNNYKNVLESIDNISTGEHSNFIEHIRRASAQLSSCSSSIPTLAELKTKYQKEMKSQEGNTHRDVVRVHEQTVIIEEIE